MPLALRLIAPLAIAIAFFSLTDARQEVGSPTSVWHDDYSKALAAARQSGKPLFVVFCCLHWLDNCKFDEQVARLDNKIAELGKQFVLLRLTSMRGVNLDVFDFDYDLTWSATFLTADERVLGRFGGRTPDDFDKFRTIDALQFAMAAALKKHKQRAIGSSSEGMIIGPHTLKSRNNIPPRTVDQYPGFVKFGPKSCVHCHHAYDLRREMMQDNETWKLDEVWVYPQPENVGLTLAVTPGNLISAVAAKSPADAIGMKANDLLQAVNDMPVATFSDVQYALHKAPIAGNVGIKWERSGQAMQATLQLKQGWRETDVSWRRSVKGLEPGSGLNGEDLTPAEKNQLGLSPAALAFRHGNFPTRQARQAGILQNDIIVGIDGKTPEMTVRQFDTHFRLHYRIGDTVTIQVIRDGKRLELKMNLS